jgi:hypothetical protein
VYILQTYRSSAAIGIAALRVLQDVGNVPTNESTTNESTTNESTTNESTTNESTTNESTTNESTMQVLVKLIGQAEHPKFVIDQSLRLLCSWISTSGSSALLSEQVGVDLIRFDSPSRAIAC